jgi:hypothetical protein
MTDQIRISDTSELETVPLTWDGEPLYSPATVQEGLFAPDAFEQMPGQIPFDAIPLDDDQVWRLERAAAAPLTRGSAVVFTYDGHAMSGEIDDISSCGITVYGREDNRRYLVASADVRRETAREQDRRERLGYYVEDDPEHS